MATERCPKCGSEMVMAYLKPVYASLDAGPEPDTVSMAYRYSLRCSLDPKDCRIAELELAVACEKDDACHARGERDEARARLEEAKANTEAVVAELLKHDAPVIAELKSQLRESQLAVVALRETAQEVLDETDHLDSCESPAEDDGCTCGYRARYNRLDTLISNTSAAAQRVRAEIERGALKKADVNVRRILRDAGRSQGLIDWVSAAILGENP